MKILRKKTDSFDGILSSFNKTIARLEAFSTRRQNDADQAAAVITQKQGEKDAALNDVARSGAVRAKINDLIAA